MNNIHLKSTLALALLAGLAIAPAQAVELSFAGEVSVKLEPLNGHDGGAGAIDAGVASLGNQWQINNGALVPPVNSGFGVADAVVSAPPLNQSNAGTGVGGFANSFQLTVTKVPSGAGVNGIIQTVAALAGPLENFTVEPETNPTTLATFTPAHPASHDLPHAIAHLLNGVIFAALPTTPGPASTGGFYSRLHQAGVLTEGSIGVVASFLDWQPPGRTGIIAAPEPGTIALLGLGLLGILTVSRRRRS